MATTNLATIEDLTGADDGYRYDLILGELYQMPRAGDDHGALAGRVAVAVGRVVLDRRLGNIYVAEPGFVLSRNPDTLVAPDVAFVRAERLEPDRDRRKFLQIVPDLAVEVVSPSETPRMIADKIHAYVAAGIPLLWVMEPIRREVAVHGAGRAPVVLREGDILDGGDVIPGLRLPIEDLFGF